MKSTKILNSEIEELKISSLPTKPTAPKSLGGAGYTSKEMKEAFDKLPLFIVERFNSLIEDINDYGDDSLASSVATGIKDGHTLTNLFTDITSGEMATYFTIFGESLLSHILGIKSEIDLIKTKLDALTGGSSNG